MTKLTVLVSLMLIGMAWCACDSCGAECARACGTRRFRACCFNYLRRKRTDEREFWTPNAGEIQSKSKIPVIIIRYIPEDLTNILSEDFKIYDEMQD